MRSYSLPLFPPLWQTYPLLIVSQNYRLRWSYPWSLSLPITCSSPSLTLPVTCRRLQRWKAQQNYLPWKLLVQHCVTTTSYLNCCHGIVHDIGSMYMHTKDISHWICIFFILCSWIRLAAIDGFAWKVSEVGVSLPYIDGRGRKRMIKVIERAPDVHVSLLSFWNPIESLEVSTIYQWQRHSHLAISVWVRRHHKAVDLG